MCRIFAALNGKRLSWLSGAAQRGVKVAVCWASPFVDAEIKHRQSTRGRPFTSQSAAYCSITRPATRGRAQNNCTAGEGPCATGFDAFHTTPHFLHVFPACVPLLLGVSPRLHLKDPKYTKSNPVAEHSSTFIHHRC